MTCSMDALKSAALQSHTLLSALVRHEQTVYAQVSQSAACMAAHNVEARLCRLLLRARDLADTDTLEFTQEFLAEMLGVKRTSVTLHARTLQGAGMIKYSRGRIQIIDVEAMQETVCECYGTVKSYYQALLGHTQAKCLRSRHPGTDRKFRTIPGPASNVAQARNGHGRAGRTETASLL
jgi:hypothetical protein